MSSQLKITQTTILTMLTTANALLRPTAFIADANTSTRNSRGTKIALTRRIDTVSTKRPCPYMIATIWSANR